MICGVCAAQNLEHTVNSVLLPNQDEKEFRSPDLINFWPIQLLRQCHCMRCGKIWKELEYAEGNK